MNNEFAAEIEPHLNDQGVLLCHQKHALISIHASSYGNWACFLLHPLVESFPSQKWNLHTLFSPDHSNWYHPQCLKHCKLQFKAYAKMYDDLNPSNGDDPHTVSAT